LRCCLQVRTWATKGSIPILQEHSVRLWVWASILEMGSPKLLQNKACQTSGRKRVKILCAERSDRKPLSSHGQNVIQVKCDQHGPNGGFREMAVYTRANKQKMFFSRIHSCHVFCSTFWVLLPVLLIDSIRARKIRKKTPPRGGFLFTMFSHREPCAGGPPVKKLYQVLRGGSSYTRFLMREIVDRKPPRGGEVLSIKVPSQSIRCILGTFLTQI